MNRTRTAARSFTSFPRRGDCNPSWGRGDGGNWQVIAPGESNDIKLSKGAKKITFRGTKADGSTVEIEKVIDRIDEKTVEVEPVAAGSTDTSNSTDGSASSTSSDSDSSGSSPLLIGAAVVLILVLAAVALNGRRKKAAK
ncbi:MAG: hypothetical protein FJW98_09115 [Actinobacteria bacterium]|nr:hypothetical protein [Actinomycetota bacterium]